MRAALLSAFVALSSVTAEDALSGRKTDLEVSNQLLLEDNPFVGGSIPMYGTARGIMASSERTYKVLCGRGVQCTLELNQEVRVRPTRGRSASSARSIDVEMGDVRMTIKGVKESGYGSVDIPLINTNSSERGIIKWAAFGTIGSNDAVALEVSLRHRAMYLNIFRYFRNINVRLMSEDKERSSRDSRDWPLRSIVGGCAVRNELNEALGGTAQSCGEVNIGDANAFDFSQISKEVNLDAEQNGSTTDGPLSQAISQNGSA